MCVAERPPEMSRRCICDTTCAWGGGIETHAALWDQKEVWEAIKVGISHVWKDGPEARMTCQ